MKRVIALFGTGESGKTTTLNLVFEKLEEYISLENLEYHIDGYDIRRIFTFNGKKVGFETQGDPNSRLGESLKLFKDLNCDIVVCATRTRGSTCDLVIDYFGSSHFLSWREQSRVWDENLRQPSNNATAKLIVDELMNVTLVTNVKETGTLT